MHFLQQNTFMFQFLGVFCLKFLKMTPETVYLFISQSILIQFNQQDYNYLNYLNLVLEGIAFHRNEFLTVDGNTFPRWRLY